MVEKVGPCQKAVTGPMTVPGSSVMTCLPFHGQSSYTLHRIRVGSALVMKRTPTRIVGLSEWDAEALPGGRAARPLPCSTAAPVRHEAAGTAAKPLEPPHSFFEPQQYTCWIVIVMMM